MSVNDEQREEIGRLMAEAHMTMDGHKATDEQVARLSMIVAMRGIQDQQRQLTQQVTATNDGIHAIKEQMARWEGNINKIASLESELDGLKEEKQRRAGMQWLVEWVAKYIPWLLAAAAAVWALKVGKDA